MIILNMEKYMKRKLKNKLKEVNWYEVTRKLVILLIIIGLLLIPILLHLDEPSIEEPKEIRAIIGEASGEGYLGMLHIASAIRNRGHLKGVYGVNALHIKFMPFWVWEQAKRAWEESEYNRTHTGDHWGSKKYDKKWIVKMEANPKLVKVYEYKNHVWYKEIK